MKLEFKPEDFPVTQFYTYGLRHNAAFLAQEKFDAWLKENGKVVYGHDDLDAWYYSEEQIVKYKPNIKALVVCIEPIEQCTHPKDKVNLCTGQFSGIAFYECTCGSRVQPSGFEKVASK